MLLAVVLPSSSLRGGQTTIGDHTFTLPDGFEIELVAGPPLVDRPISAAFDEQGRLYVPDSSGSNDPVEKQLADKPHRIVRLEDSDGDGRFDKSVVFADRMMFPAGAMWHDGSLYVTAPPSIWKLTDTTGDGVADRREEWFKGGTLTGCANDLHGPFAGPDGFIYWCKGAFAEQTHERAGRPPIKDRAAHIFRCRPDGTDLEVIMSGGMDNPVEVAFTHTGEPIFTATFLDLSGAGKRDGLAHAVYGGVFPKVNEVTDGVTHTGPLLPAMTHFGPGAPSGICRTESAGLGEEFRDNFFVTLFNLHKVTRHTIEPAGGTFRTHDSDFVVSDKRDFHPTDVLEDADGSLLIIDTGGWYKLCCPTSQLARPDVLGGIYRVRRSGLPPMADPRGLQLTWSGANAETLVERLEDPRPAVVQRSVDDLVRLGESAVEPLRAMLNGTAPAPVRQHALWALSRISGTAARMAVRGALADPQENIRTIAVKIAGLWRDKESAEVLLTYLGATDSTPHLARTSAEALGRIGDARAIAPLFRTIQTSSADRFLEHTAIFALIEIDNAAATAPFTRETESASVRNAAFITLEQTRTA
jgi:putative membrane-bound dehydrogenase-like protein